MRIYEDLARSERGQQLLHDPVPSYCAAKHKMPVDVYAHLQKKYLDLTGIQRHLQVRDGMPTVDLLSLAKSFVILSPGTAFKALGVCKETIRRRKDGKLNPAHSNAALALFVVSTAAGHVLGRLEAAEKWLTRSTLSLDSQRPIDLLSSNPGIESVKELLQRIEYGTYA